MVGRVSLAPRRFRVHFTKSFQGNNLTDSGQLPPFLRGVIDEHPQVWEAYQALGQSVGEAGPLDERDQRLVKLALAIGAKSEGAVHSHTRRALAEDIPPHALYQVALLAITTIGWSSAMAGLSWMRDVVEKRSN